MANLLVWVLLGGVFGWLAWRALPSPGVGRAGNVSLGVLGALVGGLVATAFAAMATDGVLGPTGPGGLDAPACIVAAGGAVVLLALIHLIGLRRTLRA